MPKSTFAELRAKAPQNRFPDWLFVRNEASSPNAEIYIYNSIGKSLYDEGGTSADDFRRELEQIPRGRPINVRLNSPGGNVWDGMAIYRQLNNRKEDVTCYVDGTAASITAIIACAGKKTKVHKGSTMMVHASESICGGNKTNMRISMEKLEAHDRAIAGIIADKTGKSQDEVMAILNQGELWMGGEAAIAFGLADELIKDGEITNEAKSIDLTAYRRVPEWLTDPNNQSASGREQKGNEMDKSQIIALLKQHGVEVSNDATTEQLLAKLNEVMNKAKAPAQPSAPAQAPAAPAAAAPVAPQNVVDLQTQVANITKQLEGERKDRITKAVQACVDEGRIPVAQAEAWTRRAMTDETVLNDLRAMPNTLPGAEPVDAADVRVVNESARNVLKAIASHIISNQNGGPCPKAFETAVPRNQAIGMIYRKERDNIIQVMNAVATNTIPADLKRVLILNETVRAFARRVVALRMFASVFENIPQLQGTDEAVVTYFPLQTAASSNFDPAVGYVFGQNTTTSSKKITFDRRKYQPMDFSSQEFARQPYFDVVRLGQMNAEKLAFDILLDVLSIVTAANFGAPAIKIAPETYTSDDITKLGGICTDADWPDAGRGLFVNTTVDTSLKGDPAYKLAQNIAGTEVLRDGKLPMQLGGFEYATMPRFPENGEGLVGFAAFMSAILFAAAPVAPAPDVRAQLSAYEMATDPGTGISMNYRAWGDPDGDRSKRIFESAYGFAAGEAAAIKRLTKV